MAETGLEREIRIVEEALEQPPLARDSFIARACGEDLGLRKNVVELLGRIDRGEASRDLFNALLPVLRSKSTIGADTASDSSIADLRALGKYRIERELGRGGQGVVYLAIDETLDRRVALKVLHPSAALEPTTRQRFLREAGIASRLDHPGICVVYETGQEQGIDYIAMRYVEGSTLNSRIANQATNDLRGFVPGDQSADPLRAIAHLIEKIARALHLAHEAGVIHRDVKSGNIIVTPDGEPVILDFGLAREQAPGTTITLSAEILGTPAFMSPEQVSGPVRGLERRTDVWSLGVVLYQCLTLSLPFDGPTIHEILRRIRDDEPPGVRKRNPAVPRDLEVIVSTALEKDLTRRYRTALDLAEDLRRFRVDETILARPAGPVRRAIRYTQRHPMRAIAIVLGAIVVALGAGSALLTRSLGERTRELLKHNDLQSARGMEVEANTTLWPVREDAVSQFDGWLAKLGRLAAHRQEHESALLEIESRKLPDGSWANDFDWTFGSLLEEHLGILDRLDLLERAVHDRRDRSATLRERTIDAFAADCTSVVSAVEESSLYHGLEFVPQPGLVPLGRNEQGYFEFWHTESGERPVRDGGGNLVIGERTGIVLVLVPGGNVALGACKAGPFRNDPNVQLSEALAWVTLDPLFISKYEMTQGQWLQLYGVNPSSSKPGPGEGGNVRDLSNPVESITWAQCVEALRRLDLELPTDAQWEYACRAGTETIWNCGDDLVTAGTFANFHGEEANPHYKQLPPDYGYRDPFVRHAPVGSFPPNGFGLHDMHGNVFEWCRDRYLRAAETLTPEPGTGLREPIGEPGQRCVRGGGCTANPSVGRSAARGQLPMNTTSHDLGMRAARRLK